MTVERRAVLVGLVCLLPARAAAQGFAGLGTTAEGFAVPRRGAPLVFPRDHFAHPDYRIEWWYLTVTLEDAEGTQFGAQWTLFRSALAPGDSDGLAAPRQVWFGHAAVTSPERHLYAERFARGGIGQAEVARPFAARIDDWAMESRAAEGVDPLDALQVSARGEDFAYALSLDAEGPLVLHGAGGYSEKAPGGQASFYYSQPHYRVSGRVDLPGGAIDVTGRGWLDREWSSQPLAADQAGWDWFSLAFDDGAKLMAFGLRATDGGHFTSATWIAPDGRVTAHGDGAVRLTPLGTAQVAGRDLPVRWRLELPAEGLDVETVALNPEAWMGTSFPYWEGPVAARGSHVGRGYLEMTGYPRVE